MAGSMNRLHSDPDGDPGYASISAGDYSDISADAPMLVRGRRVPCRWFLRCQNPSTGYTPHPVLGQVPTCDRCARFATS